MRRRRLPLRILAAPAPPLSLGPLGCRDGSLDAGAALDADALDAAQPATDASDDTDAGAPEARLLAPSREGRVASIDVAAPWTVRATADRVATIASARCRGAVCLVVQPLPIDAVTVLGALELTVRAMIALPTLEGDPVCWLRPRDYRSSPSPSVQQLRARRAERSGTTPGSVAPPGRLRRAIRASGVAALPPSRSSWLRRRVWAAQAVDLSLGCLVWAAQARDPRRGWSAWACVVTPDACNSFWTEQAHALALDRAEALLFSPDPCTPTPSFARETGVHVFDAHRRSRRGRPDRGRPLTDRAGTDALSSTP